MPPSLYRRAEREVQTAVDELNHYLARLAEGHNDGAESFNDALNRLSDIHDDLEAAADDDADGMGG